MVACTLDHELADARRRMRVILLCDTPRATQGAGSLTLPHIRQLLQDNFAVWGVVTNIYIKHQATIAFVT
jgi:hypothetical protein